MTILEQLTNSGSPPLGNRHGTSIGSTSSNSSSGFGSSISPIGNALISAMADRYITPEYLAPLPPTSGDKSGKSPLQLLAQTCSQIGADTGSNKLLQEKSGSSNNGDGGSKGGNKSGRSPNLIVSDSKPVSFKPYETGLDHNGKPPSKPSSIMSLSPKSSSSPKIRSNGSANGKSPSPKNGSSSVTPPVSSAPRSSSAASSETTTPVIRSGMEVLAGTKDPLAAYRSPLDPSNPAFRPPFGMPGMAPQSSLSVCRDPYCRDPSCPTAVYNAQLASLTAAGSLPPGYAELLYAHKLGLTGLPGMTPTTTSASVAAAAAVAAMSVATSGSNGVHSGPYICNWMNGREGYCGKRHSSAEELLQHLRTHTNLSTSDSAASSLLSNPGLYPPGLMGPGGGASAAAAAAAGLHRTYGGSALGSLAAANRFHPYAKPGGMSGGLPHSLSGLGALGYPPTSLSNSLAGLGGAYSASSLYALYGSRLAGSLP
eukprot:maker-scaffold240_size241964-snap-gene-0.8 protein:Tk08261 transcript:maker-scaffold240_size241964-snap-gene-0.8-mRNA-1 annotation:"zinc finger protein noc-like"